MTGVDAAWIGRAIQAARPRAMAALLRQVRDLDRAEDAFQQASLRAVERWTCEGAPYDPLAWLIRVGRNAATDEARRTRLLVALPEEPPPEDQPGDHVEAALIDGLDAAPYRDDVLRLLFTCCHPELPPAHQIALALRVVSGLSVGAIARAFLVSESAMEQRITRAKRRVAAAALPYATPGEADRQQRVLAVALMVYLLFNEGYAASGGEAHIKADLCEEAIRLARLLLQLFPAEPEIMGLTALLLLQHARAPARLDAAGAIVVLDDQDRALWDRPRIAEGLVLVEKALRHRRPGPYQVQAAIAAMHARATTPAATDWAEIDRLYGVLEHIQPSPVVALNRAVVTARLRGPAAALAAIEPLEPQLGAYLPYVGVRGALLAECGRSAEARVAWERAKTLARTPAELAHLDARLGALEKA